MKALLAAATVAAALVASGAPAGDAAVTVHKPTAAITFGTNVVVKGKYFKKREAVTVTLKSTDHTWVRKAHATATGTFSVSFGSLSLNSCSEYTLTVVGSLKSRFSTSHSLVPC